MKKQCPLCQSYNIIPIVYGYPPSDAGEEEEKGFILLGGCVINDGSPRWHCKNCSLEF